MTKTTIAGVSAVALAVILAIILGYRTLQHSFERSAATPDGTTTAVTAAHPSFIHGRITTVSGAIYEGRLRWGIDQEAFWSDHFNGVRTDNRWVDHVPPEQLPTEPRRIEIFGVSVGRQQRPLDLGRPFMVRFGDIARIETLGVNEVRVSLKNGTVVDLNRLDASDFDDSMRVWDATRGVMDVDRRLLRTIELFPPPVTGTPPDRLHGTVRTRDGDFTGFVQWHREMSLGTDELEGRADDGTHSIPFGTIRSIAKNSPDSSLVTLADGSEVVLSGTREAGRGNGGIYVDDSRYGRVLVSWDAFERIDFSAPEAAGSGPAYDDFPPGAPITGGVTTRDGRRLEGRLVFDLDETETIETLDAPRHGVDYTIPFGLIASIAPLGPEEGARVTFHSGEELVLEHEGDLGSQNAGLLIFAEGVERGEYLRWADVARIDLDRPGAMYPPIE
ncbi:MAG: hypothetical protein KY459_03800 [Acidobacteria bacterium]|nr:hypothetical protein [Acidobacteriota bacterium]